VRGPLRRGALLFLLRRWLERQWERRQCAPNAGLGVSDFGEHEAHRGALPDERPLHVLVGAHPREARLRGWPRHPRSPNRPYRRARSARISAACDVLPSFS